MLYLIKTISIFLLFSPIAAYSDALYRCAQSNGTLSFQKTACSGDGVLLDIKPIKSTGWVALRPAEKKLLRHYRKRDKAKYKTKRSGKKQLAKRDVTEEKCWKKRKNLEAVNAKLRQGYKASQYNSLHRRRNTYQEYLNKFCAY